MRSYEQVTIEPVQRGGMTAWRVVGMDNEKETVNHCVFSQRRRGQANEKGVNGAPPRARIVQTMETQENIALCYCRNPTRLSRATVRAKGPESTYRSRMLS